MGWAGFQIRVSDYTEEHSYAIPRLLRIRVGAGVADKAPAASKLLMPPRVGQLVRKRAGKRLLLLAASSVFFGGCAIGNYGSIIARVTEAQGSWVLDTYTVGLRVHGATGDDVGVRLGLSRESWVFSDSEVVVPRPGWYHFVLPSLQYDKAVLHRLSMFGADIRFGRPEPGVTLGFQELIAPTPVPSSGSAFRSILYMPDAPQLTCVSLDWRQQC